jgi:hypothetical protein
MIKAAPSGRRAALCPMQPSALARGVRPAGRSPRGTRLHGVPPKLRATTVRSLQKPGYGAYTTLSLMIFRWPDAGMPVIDESVQQDHLSPRRN